MAMPYDYVFASDIPPLPPFAVYRLSPQQVRFLLSAINPYKNGVLWFDSLDKEVPITDAQQAEIDDIWNELQKNF